MMLRLLAELGLVAHPEKTEAIDFPKKGELLAGSKVLNYLGFTFDGVNKRIRPASVARYYKKMRSGVGRAKAIRYRADKKARVWPPSKLKRRRLHILYTYLGRHNFLSYAFDAARIMKDSGIKDQVRAHWKRLQDEIGDQQRVRLLDSTALMGEPCGIPKPRLLTTQSPFPRTTVRNT
jgi:RNA-directed DNA polymerase